MTIELCSIHWKSLLTGATGHGELIEHSIAEAWLKVLVRPDVTHWLECLTYGSQSLP